MAKLTMNMLVTLRKGKRNNFFVLLLKTQCLVVWEILFFLSHLRRKALTVWCEVNCDEEYLVYIEDKLYYQFSWCGSDKRRDRRGNCQPARRQTPSSAARSGSIRRQMGKCKLRSDRCNRRPSRNSRWCTFCYCQPTRSRWRWNNSRLRYNWLTRWYRWRSLPFFSLFNVSFRLVWFTLRKIQ